VAVLLPPLPWWGILLATAATALAVALPLRLVDLKQIFLIIQQK